MQVPVSLSTSSTMTKGFSSSVTMDRWLSSSSASPKELKRGHTGYLRERLRLSSFPIWRERQKKRLRGEGAGLHVLGEVTLERGRRLLESVEKSEQLASLALPVTTYSSATWTAVLLKTAAVERIVDNVRLDSAGLATHARINRDHTRCRSTSPNLSASKSVSGAFKQRALF